MSATSTFSIRSAAFHAVVIAVTLAMGVFLGCAGDEGIDQRGDTTAVDTATVMIDTAAVSDESIYDVLRGDERFSFFVAAVDSADLDQTLSGPGPFTVFAPVDDGSGEAGANANDALLELDEDALRDLVLGHIANGERMASALQDETIRTLSGVDLDVSSDVDSLRVDDVAIVEADIEAANGVVHAVSRILSASMDEEGL